MEQTMSTLLPNIKLYERHRQWQLELVPRLIERVDDDDDLEKGLQRLGRQISNAVSSILQTAGKQLGGLATSHDGPHPRPDAWRILGARDRMLTPRSYQFTILSRVEAAMSAAGDVTSPITISGLTTSSISADTRLIFVYVPTSEFMNQLRGEPPYTVSELTCRDFVPFETRQRRPKPRPRPQTEDREIQTIPVEEPEEEETEEETVPLKEMTEMGTQTMKVLIHGITQTCDELWPPEPLPPEVSHMGVGSDTAIYPEIHYKDMGVGHRVQMLDMACGSHHNVMSTGVGSDDAIVKPTPTIARAVGSGTILDDRLKKYKQTPGSIVTSDAIHVANVQTLPKSTVVTTYDIEYTREEIFDGTPARMVDETSGLHASHVSKSYTVTPEGKEMDVLETWSSDSETRMSTISGSTHRSTPSSRTSPSSRTGFARRHQKGTNAANTRDSSPTEKSRLAIAESPSRSPQAKDRSRSNSASRRRLELTKNRSRSNSCSRRGASVTAGIDKTHADVLKTSTKSRTRVPGKDRSRSNSSSRRSSPAKIAKASPDVIFSRDSLISKLLMSVQVEREAALEPLSHSLSLSSQTSERKARQSIKLSATSKSLSGASRSPSSKKSQSRESDLSVSSFSKPTDISEGNVSPWASPGVNATACLETLISEEEERDLEKCKKAVSGEVQEVTTAITPIDEGVQEKTTDMLIEEALKRCAARADQENKAESTERSFESLSPLSVSSSVSRSPVCRERHEYFDTTSAAEIRDQRSFTSVTSIQKREESADTISDTTGGLEAARPEDDSEKAADPSSDFINDDSECSSLENSNQTISDVFSANRKMGLSALETVFVADMTMDSLPVDQPKRRLLPLSRVAPWERIQALVSPPSPSSRSHPKGAHRAASSSPPAVSPRWRKSSAPPTTGHIMEQQLFSQEMFIQPPPPPPPPSPPTPPSASPRAEDLLPEKQLSPLFDKAVPSQPFIMGHSGEAHLLSAKMQLYLRQDVSTSFQTASVDHLTEKQQLPDQAVPQSPSTTGVHFEKQISPKAISLSTLSSEIVGHLEKSLSPERIVPRPSSADLFEDKQVVSPLKPQPQDRLVGPRKSRWEKEQAGQAAVSSSPCLLGTASFPHIIMKTTELEKTQELVPPRIDFTFPQPRTRRKSSSASLLALELSTVSEEVEIVEKDEIDQVRSAPTGPTSRESGVSISSYITPRSPEQIQPEGISPQITDIKSGDISPFHQEIDVLVPPSLSVSSALSTPSRSSLQSDLKQKTPTPKASEVSQHGAKSYATLEQSPQFARPPISPKRPLQQGTKPQIAPEPLPRRDSSVTPPAVQTQDAVSPVLTQEGRNESSPSLKHLSQHSFKSAASQELSPQQILTLPASPGSSVYHRVKSSELQEQLPLQTSRPSTSPERSTPIRIRPLSSPDLPKKRSPALPVSPVSSAQHSLKYIESPEPLPQRSTKSPVSSSWSPLPGIKSQASPDASPKGVLGSQVSPAMSAQHAVKPSVSPEHLPQPSVRSSVHQKRSSHKNSPESSAKESVGSSASSVLKAQRGIKPLVSPEPPQRTPRVTVPPRWSQKQSAKPGFQIETKHQVVTSPIPQRSSQSACVHSPKQDSVPAMTSPTPLTKRTVKSSVSPASSLYSPVSMTSSPKYSPRSPVSLGLSKESSRKSLVSPSLSPQSSAKQSVKSSPSLCSSPRQSVKSTSPSPQPSVKSVASRSSPSPHSSTRQSVRSSTSPSLPSPQQSVKSKTSLSLSPSPSPSPQQSLKSLLSLPRLSPQQQRSETPRHSSQQSASSTVSPTLSLASSLPEPELVKVMSTTSSQSPKSIPSPLPSPCKVSSPAADTQNLSSPQPARRLSTRLSFAQALSAATSPVQIKSTSPVAAKRTIKQTASAGYASRLPFSWLAAPVSSPAKSERGTKTSKSVETSPNTAQFARPATSLGLSDKSLPQVVHAPTTRQTTAAARSPVSAGSSPVSPSVLSNKIPPSTCFEIVKVVSQRSAKTPKHTSPTPASRAGRSPICSAVRAYHVDNFEEPVKYFDKLMSAEYPISLDVSPRQSSQARQRSASPKRVKILPDAEPSEIKAKNAVAMISVRSEPSPTPSFAIKSPKHVSPTMFRQASPQSIPISPEVSPLQIDETDDQTSVTAFGSSSTSSPFSPAKSTRLTLKQDSETMLIPSTEAFVVRYPPLVLDKPLSASSKELPLSKYAATFSDDTLQTASSEEPLFGNSSTVFEQTSSREEMPSLTIRTYSERFQPADTSPTISSMASEQSVQLTTELEGQSTKLDIDTTPSIVSPGSSRYEVVSLSTAVSTSCESAVNASQVMSDQSSPATMPFSPPTTLNSLSKDSPLSRMSPTSPSSSVSVPSRSSRASTRRLEEESEQMKIMSPSDRRSQTSSASKSPESLSSTQSDSTNRQEKLKSSLSPKSSRSPSASSGASPMLRPEATAVVTALAASLMTSLLRDLDNSSPPKTVMAVDDSAHVEPTGSKKSPSVSARSCVSARSSGSARSLAMASDISPCSPHSPMAPQVHGRFQVTLSVPSPALSVSSKQTTPSPPKGSVLGQDTSSAISPTLSVSSKQTTPSVPNEGMLGQETTNANLYKMAFISPSVSSLSESPTAASMGRPSPVKSAAEENVTRTEIPSITRREISPVPRPRPRSRGLASPVLTEEPENAVDPRRVMSRSEYLASPIQGLPPISAFSPTSPQQSVTSSYEFEGVTSSSQLEQDEVPATSVDADSRKLQHAELLPSAVSTTGSTVDDLTKAGLSHSQVSDSVDPPSQTQLTAEEKLAPLIVEPQDRMSTTCAVPVTRKATPPSTGHHPRSPERVTFKLDRVPSPASVISVTSTAAETSVPSVSPSLSPRRPFKPLPVSKISPAKTSMAELLMAQRIKSPHKSFTHKSTLKSVVNANMTGVTVNELKTLLEKQRKSKKEQNIDIPKPKVVKGASAEPKGTFLRMLVNASEGKTSPQVPGSVPTSKADFRKDLISPVKRTGSLDSGRKPNLGNTNNTAFERVAQKKQRTVPQPIEHVTTSVVQKRVSVEGQLPSSKVTITQRKVTYTAEPVDVCKTANIQSPPKILSWPLKTQKSLPQPIPIMPGQATNVANFLEEVVPGQKKSTQNADRPHRDQYSSENVIRHHRSPSKRKPSIDHLLPAGKVVGREMEVDVRVRSKHLGKSPHNSNVSPSHQKVIMDRLAFGHTLRVSPEKIKLDRKLSPQIQPGIPNPIMKPEVYPDDRGSVVSMPTKVGPSPPGPRKVKKSSGPPTPEERAMILAATMQNKLRLSRMASPGINAAADSVRQSVKETRYSSPVREEVTEKTHYSPSGRGRSLRQTGGEISYPHGGKDQKTTLSPLINTHSSSENQLAFRQAAVDARYPPSERGEPTERPPIAKPKKKEVLPWPPMSVVSTTASEESNEDFSDFFSKYLDESNKKGLTPPHALRKPRMVASPQTPRKREGIDPYERLRRAFEKRRRNITLSLDSNATKNNVAGTSRRSESDERRPTPTQSPRLHPYPADVAVYPGRNEQPIGQQLQAHRHKQGLIGDSSEIMPHGRPPVTQQLDIPYPDQSRTRARRKPGRRVSWNDDQSRLPTRYRVESKNQNAAVSSESISTTAGSDTLERTLDRHEMDMNGKTGMRSPTVTVSKAGHRASGTKEGDKVDNSDGNLGQIFVRRSTMLRFEPHPRGPRETQNNVTELKVQRSDTQASQYTNDFRQLINRFESHDSRREGTSRRPVGYLQQRKDRKEFAVRQNETTAHASVEKMQRRHFRSDQNLTHDTKEQSLRKRYTFQDRGKRVSMTEEHQQSQARVLKKSPRTALIPEQPGRPNTASRSYQFPCNYHTPVSSGGPLRVRHKPHEKENQSGNNQYRPWSCESVNDMHGTSAAKNALSLSEELRNAGWCPEKLPRDPPQIDAEIANLEVRATEFEEWSDEEGTPSCGCVPGNHVHDVNESANSSSRLGKHNENSDENDAWKWNSGFCTLSDVTSQRHIFHGALSNADKSEQDGDMRYQQIDEDGVSVHSIVYNVHNHEPAICPRRCNRNNDNINNSGNDNPANTPKKTNMCTPIGPESPPPVSQHREEPQEATGGLSSLESTRRYGVRSYPRAKTSMLRKRRSYGRSYLSRLLSHRQKENTESHDLKESGIQKSSCRTKSDTERPEASTVRWQGAPDKCHECRVAQPPPGDSQRRELVPDESEMYTKATFDRDSRLVFFNTYSEGECACTVVDVSTTCELHDRRYVPRAFTEDQDDYEEDDYENEDYDPSPPASQPEEDERENSVSSYEVGEVWDCPKPPSNQSSAASAYTDDDGSCRHTGKVYTPGRSDSDEDSGGEKDHQACARDGSMRKKGSSSGTADSEACEVSHAYPSQESTSQATFTPSPTSDKVSPNIRGPPTFAATESMVQAYGYNPLTVSPFTARGYPQLDIDELCLDYISVPFVKRKALVFLRSDKEEFVEVGRGTYGCVYLAEATTRRGTAKVVVKDFFTDSSTWELIVHEARMLAYLQDTGVIPHFYGLLKRRSMGDDYSLIMQYFGQGKTLHTSIVNKEDMPPVIWQDVAWQLARGLLLIHERHVLLNDLKGDNVLIDVRRERKVIKYIDLGMATYRKGLNFHLPEDQMCKFNFLAPEVRAGAFTSPMSDVFSLGYLLEQINRLAKLPVLAETAARCMDDMPVDRPHLAQVVDALQIKSEYKPGVATSDVVRH